MVISMVKSKVLSLLLLLALLVSPARVLAADVALPQESAAATEEASAPESTGEAETGEAPEPSDVPEAQQTPPATRVNSDAGIDAETSLAPQDALDADAAVILLYEMDSETMVYARGIDDRREPASLTKVMTCLLALEHGTLTDEIKVSEKALANMDPDGSSSDLTVGDTFTLEQLLYCLMIESANDAAAVIAEYVSGSEEAFVSLMNEKARELGCTGTHFANPHGLHDDNHYTTARDMAKIMLAALEYEKFQEIYSTGRYTLPASSLREERVMVTTNFLIGTSVTQDYYDDRVIGGKTGFTTPAGRCVMCVAQEDGLRYLCVILGAPTISTDTYTVYGNFVAASKALDYGFDNFTFAEVLSPLAPIAQLPVSEATQSVVLTPAQSVTTMLPADYDETLLTTRYELTAQEGLTAPLEAGQAVGVVRKYYGSICVGETELVTVTAVERRAVAAAMAETMDEIRESPWRFVIIILAVLLGLLIFLMLFSALIRRRNRRRRRQRRAGR